VNVSGCRYFGFVILVKVTIHEEVVSAATFEKSECSAYPLGVIEFRLEVFEYVSGHQLTGDFYFSPMGGHTYAP